VRISELARVTGVPVPTVKYYLREGLLPQGTVTSRTQAEYGEDHARRLRLLRVLREVGDVPVGRLRDLVAAVEAEGLNTHDVLAAAAVALAPVPPPPGPARELARALADDLVARAGWDRVAPDSPDRESLAAQLEAVIALGTHEDKDPELLLRYVEAVDALAQWEIADLDETAGPESVMQQMVVGQVVFGEVLATLRRLAEEHYSAERFAPRRRATSARRAR
jgi:DNA-binding transcriptional MerR regulator